jgi:hypothetical protein
MSQPSLGVWGATRAPGAPAARSAITFAVGAAVAVAADLAFDPVDRHVPLCPFRAATGMWCPLCGGLRSVYELAHGRLVTAWHDNAVFVTLLPLFFVMWAEWLVRSRSGRAARKIGRTATIGAVLVAVVFTILRNTTFGRALSPS